MFSLFFHIHFQLQYELLFCIEDKSDPAIGVVEALMHKYPKIDSKLFLGRWIFVIHRINSMSLTIIVYIDAGGSNVGVNPKINNMNPGYEAAKYELIMISDSGIRSKYFN